MLINPVFFGIIFMCVLCLFRFNVILSIISSSLLVGIISGNNFTETANTLIAGMSANLETALSYILLGALAAIIGDSNLSNILIYKVSKIINNKRIMLILIIAMIACFSQNIIPIHIAFIPILIPPLLSLFNKLKIDRRAIACALTFGLKAPYVSFSVGFGLIFHTIIKDNMISNGIEVSIKDISSVMWIGGLSMLFGLILSIFFYSDKREYKQIILKTYNENQKDLKLKYKELVILGGLAITLIVQLYTNSMVLGAFFGLIFIIIFKGVNYNNIENIMMESFRTMSFIAFTILIAGGFANCLKESGGIEEFISLAISISNGKLGAAIIMLSIGLIITTGIGSSFGSIPILSVIYIPLCMELGFSINATILLIGISAAIGDAGSPASDSTLGPTSGLNADNQHNHIYDTCVPTFIFFNIPLMIGGIIFSLIL